MVPRCRFQMMSSWSGWWCNVPILKNDGVRQCSKPPTRFYTRWKKIMGTLPPWTSTFGLKNGVITQKNGVITSYNPIMN
jgi:hypothetical protein